MSDGVWAWVSRAALEGGGQVLGKPERESLVSSSLHREKPSRHHLRCWEALLPSSPCAPTSAAQPGPAPPWAVVEKALEGCPRWRPTSRLAISAQHAACRGAEGEGLDPAPLKSIGSLWCWLKLDFLVTTKLRCRLQVQR